MHLLPVQVNSVYLDLTFITLAMLVVGGATSLFGAVVGALAVSALDSWLVRRRERHVALRLAHRPAGRHARRSSSAILMAAVLILRPSGLTGGRELRLRGVRMARVCVAGAGVIGSLFAAHLARVAEVSALTRREEHADALRTHGLAGQRPRGLHGATRRGDEPGSTSRSRSS